MNLIVIEMAEGAIFGEGMDMFLFDKVLDPILPTLPLGIPTPLPVRLGLYSIELQIEAGQKIAKGDVASKYQYTGQAAQAERAQSLGFNLMYQPGGMKV
jgi:hypothetical protein